jgi:uroporphyrinogen-III decarboxylase
MDNTNIIWSVGGGMPPDVDDINIKAFIQAVKECS